MAGVGSVHNQYIIPGRLESCLVLAVLSAVASCRLVAVAFSPVGFYFLALPRSVVLRIAAWQKVINRQIEEKKRKETIPCQAKSKESGVP